MSVLWITFAWVVCGFVVWGLSLGAFTKRFPDQPHYELLVFSLGGPMSLIAFILFLWFVSDAPLAWRIRPSSREERWVVFQQKYPYSAASTGFENFR